MKLWLFMQNLCHTGSQTETTYGISIPSIPTFGCRSIWHTLDGMGNSIKKIWSDSDRVAPEIQTIRHFFGIVTYHFLEDAPCRYIYLHLAKKIDAFHVGSGIPFISSHGQHGGSDLFSRWLHQLPAVNGTKFSEATCA